MREREGEIGELPEARGEATGVEGESEKEGELEEEEKDEKVEDEKDEEEETKEVG